jgi:hypothetical protein
MIIFNTLTKSSLINITNIDECFQFHSKVINEYLTMILSSLQQLACTQEIVKTNKKQELLNNINLLHSIFDYILSLMVKYRNLKKVEEIKEIIITSYINILVDSIYFTIPENSQSIFFTLDPDINKSVNSLKASALKTITYILQFERTTISNQILLTKLTELTSKLIPHLEYVHKNKMIKYYTQMLDDNYIDQEDDDRTLFLFNVFLFFSRMLAREPVISDFIQNIIPFFKTIIFPFLMTEKEEYLEMTTNFHTYIQFFEDLTTQDFSFKQIKTSSCFLLYKLSGKY